MGDSGMRAMEDIESPRTLLDGAVTDRERNPWNMLALSATDGLRCVGLCDTRAAMLWDDSETSDSTSLMSVQTLDLSSSS